MAQARGRTSAFTLIELLVVVAVIGILASLVMPAMLTSMRRAEISKCKSNLHQIGCMVVAYAKDHGLLLPPALSWPACPIPQYGTPAAGATDFWPGRAGNLIRCLYPRYLGDRDVFLCPGGRMAWSNSGYPPVWPTPYTRWDTGQGGYLYVGNFPDEKVAPANGTVAPPARGWYPYAPKRAKMLADSPTLPLVLDRLAMYTDTFQVYEMPGVSNHVVGRKSLWGINILRLDGAVLWKSFYDTRPQFYWADGARPIAYDY